MFSNTKTVPEIITQTLQEEMKVIFTIKTVNEDKKSIIGYDLELGRFDCEDKTTLMFKDIKEFNISSEEMENIAIALRNCKK